MRIKSWESPRRRGRNDKGKGGSARQRQLKKRNKMLRNKLKRQQDDRKGGEKCPSFLLPIV
ncbi:hypothetical protein Lepto7376_2521 [[Leptolyngbya] sp. PCC 7376]|uniref:hypothetical protein n=1 Tax=[Leptolyngbya] sp. PCC 7376 TaxID=111781 RepID=UPI00029EC4C8|nr:hypothetical protein Lepto7376_2521 [[Leptolyngbya] sp. PCC 7376]